MDARNTIRRFCQAVMARDEVTASALCTDAAWHAPGDNLLQLYRQLTDRGRAYTVRATTTPLTSESARVVVRCAIAHADGEPVAQIFVLCDQVPCKVVGWTRSRRLSERYLAGIVPADLGLHSLTIDDQAMAHARELADDLLLLRVEDEHSRTRLERSAQVLGSHPAVLGYLQMRVGGGSHLVIVRTLRLATLGRVVVEARLVDAGGDRTRDEPIWLYADEHEHGELIWRAHRPLFDIDTLLG